MSVSSVPFASISLFSHQPCRNKQLHFTDEETEAQRQLGNIFKVTQLVSGKPNIWIQICMSQTFFPNNRNTLFLPLLHLCLCLIFFPQTNKNRELSEVGPEQLGLLS